jgi:hypothetical protein
MVAMFCGVKFIHIFWNFGYFIAPKQNDFMLRLMYPAEEKETFSKLLVSA